MSRELLLPGCFKLCLSAPLSHLVELDVTWPAGKSERPAGGVHQLAVRVHVRCRSAPCCCWFAAR